MAPNLPDKARRIAGSTLYSAPAPKHPRQERVVFLPTGVQIGTVRYHSGDAERPAVWTVLGDRVPFATLAEVAARARLIWEAQQD
jgi:hypothetical protein